MSGARALGLALAVLVLIGAGGIAGWSFATRWAPSPARYPLQGVDLGEHPAAAEWPTVRAAGADFAYLVATAGSDRREPSFEANWAALPEAGMRRGAVLLYSMCQGGTQQGNAFNLTVPAVADALPPAIDLAFRDDCAARPEPDALASEVARAAAVIEAHTRKPVILRVSSAVERRYRISEAVPRPLWLIRDGLAPAYAARDWRLWRASDIRRIDGIEGPVNWDVVAP